MAWNLFTAPNLGLLVYKRLYTESSIKNKIKYQPATTNDKERLFIDIAQNAKTTPFDLFYKDIFDKTLSDYSQIGNPAANKTFSLSTTYPGLFCGSGYTHDSNAKGDIKVGFYFDHTTGQPIIPGSSIKGVLKTIFENENEKTDESSLEAWKFIINKILKCVEDNNKEKWKLLGNDMYIQILKHLKKSIFGTQDNEGNDVFFDAVINIQKNGNKKFLANDFITPHQPNLLKNPIPLMFLKVRPNVVFEFRFKLTDTEVKTNNKEFTFTADDKLAFFKQIILTLGLGAKTNVGYGQFTP